MWGGCGQGSCIWGGRIQRQSKGKDVDDVAGRKKYQLNQFLLILWALKQVLVGLPY